MLTSAPWARLLLLLYHTLGCGSVWSQSPPSPTSSASSPTSLLSSSSPLEPYLSSLSSSSSLSPSFSMSPSSSSFSPSPSLLSSLSPSPSSSSLSPSPSSSSLSSSSLVPSWSPPSWSPPSWSPPSWSPPSWSPPSWSPPSRSPPSRSPPSRSPPRSPASPCGCWGKNKVYLQYKAPATGWYTTFPASRHLYERTLNISGRKVQYVLEYKNKRSPTYWVLFENRPDGVTKVISNRKEKKILVSCPSRCSCQKVSVTGTSCWAISGNYTRSGTPEDSLALIERAMRAEQSAPKNKTRSLSVLEQSNCLLAELSKCIENEDETNGQSSIPQEDSTTRVEDGCHQHVQVLTDTLQHGSWIPLSDTRHHEAYIKEGTKTYVLKQADEEDFWWIVDDTDVYAMSEDAGPCPDQLPTDCKWISVEDMKTDPNISVTCVAWDTPGGD